MDKDINIIFYGNSLTAGYGYIAEHSFPSIIKSTLDKKGYNVNIINAGVSGETSEGGLQRLNEVLNTSIDIFVLELGVNDGLRGLPINNMKQNLQSIIDKVKATNPDVELIIAGMQIPLKIENEYIRQFIQVFPALAKENNAHLIPSFLENVIGIPALNLPDGLHPNKEGYKIIANNVLQALLPLLSKFS